MDNDRKLITLDTPIEELEEKLLKEKDVDNVKNIIDLFNLNIKKKNVILKIIFLCLNHPKVIL